MGTLRAEFSCHQNRVSGVSFAAAHCMATSTWKNHFASIPPLAWVLMLTALCLVPFANKAVHIDDTLFIRAAQNIQKHPANFYGFQMNWFGWSAPMVDNFDNPPLACYYLALVGSLAGWLEPTLHLAFLLPALAAAWGMFSLAKSFSTRPLFAALVGVLTPVFLISATTLMCDVLLVAFWVWSIVWFERGLRLGNRSAFLISGLLAGLAYWTKFPALALVPLLGFWGFAERRKGGWWAASLVLPLVFAAAYEWTTFHLYGKGLLITAAGVAANTPHRSSIWEKEVLGLSFLGGCFFPILFYVPRLWSSRQFIAGLCIFAPCLLLYPRLGRYALLWGSDGRPNWLLVLQSAVFIAGGLHILLLAAADFWVRRDPPALLLTLWVLGVFVFATSLNWTVNGRSLLPMLPAVAILVARRLDWCGRIANLKSAPQPHVQNLALVDVQSPSPAESRQINTGLLRRWLSHWPIVAATALSMFVAKVDYDLAGAGRSAAALLASRFQRAGKTLWFEGHWGFQYYMEQHSARALEWPFLYAVPGDFVVVPKEAVNTYDFSKDLARLVDIVDFRPNVSSSTMSGSAGAGFYAAVYGPFPFSCGPIDPERYYIFEVTQSLESAAKHPNDISPVGAVIEQFFKERQALAQQARIKAGLN